MTEEARSGREFWLDAGQELLRRGGIVAVKDYLDQLTRFYGADQVRRNLGTVDDPDPRERLAQLGMIAIKDRMVPVDAAMRDWAGSDRITDWSSCAHDVERHTMSIRLRGSAILRSRGTFPVRA